MKDVMVDLETMGNGSQAAIIAIGAVEFDRETGELGEEFYTTVDLESSVAYGGVMDASTVLWWMQQSDAARAAFKRKGAPVGEALIQFEKWLEARAPKKEMRVWGNGATFDNVILRSAFVNAMLPVPWMYYNDRCYRTLKNERPEVPFSNFGVAHNALDDAKAQAMHLFAIDTAISSRRS